jgi:hypothetical protein
MASPQQYVNLAVSFDYTQLSDNPCWQMLDQDGRPILDQTGKESGTFALESGHNFGVWIHATHLPAGATLTVLECHLITLPILFAEGNPGGGRPGTYPYPSPFFVPAKAGTGLEGTTTSFRSANPFQPVPDPLTGGYEQRWVSEIQREVVNTGRWDTRFTLTMAIEVQGETYYRVFSFDPESSSGSGGTPPRPPSP